MYVLKAMKAIDIFEISPYLPLLGSGICYKLITNSRMVSHTCHLNHLILRTTSSSNILYPKVVGHLIPPAGIICFSWHHSAQFQAYKGNSYLQHTEAKQQIISQLDHWKTSCRLYPKGTHWTSFACPRIENSSEKKQNNLSGVCRS